MSHEYDPRWKAKRGYFAVDPLFRWLSDEECDWWEEQRLAWLATQPRWTTRPPLKAKIALVTFPGPGGFRYQFPMPEADAKSVADALGLERSQAIEAEDGWNLSERPPYRNEDVLRREFGLLPPLPKTKVDKDEVKGRVDMLDLIGRYGVQKIRTFGKRATGLCPFHNERTASFSVDLDRKLWYCHAEARGGDCFSFVQEAEDCTFSEAVRTLNRTY